MGLRASTPHPWRGGTAGAGPEHHPKGGGRAGLQHMRSGVGGGGNDSGMAALSTAVSSVVTSGAEEGVLPPKPGRRVELRLTVFSAPAEEIKPGRLEIDRIEVISPASGWRFPRPCCCLRAFSAIVEHAHISTLLSSTSMPPLQTAGAMCSGDFWFSDLNDSASDVVALPRCSTVSMDAIAPSTLLHLDFRHCRHRTNQCHFLFPYERCPHGVCQIAYIACREIMLDEITNYLNSLENPVEASLQFAPIQLEIFIGSADVLAMAHIAMPPHCLPSFTSLTMGNAYRPAATARTTSITKIVGGSAIAPMLQVVRAPDGNTKVCPGQQNPEPHPRFRDVEAPAMPSPELLN